jgi:hypothetical protein
VVGIGPIQKRIVLPFKAEEVEGIAELERDDG